MKAGTQVGAALGVAVAALLAFASIFAAMSSQPQPPIPTGTDISNSEKPDAQASAAAESKLSEHVKEDKPKEEEKASAWQSIKEEPKETSKLFSGVTTLDYQRIDRNTFTLVNEHREKLGLEQVRWDFELAAIAGRHSISMVANGYFEHADQLGLDVVDRYWLEKMSCSFPVTSKNAEGIYKSVQSVLEMNEVAIAAMTVDGWGTVIENPEAERIGAGFAIGSDGRLYSTVNLC